jgi:glycosyltransferase involved in cell wall biosynthesis
LGKISEKVSVVIPTYNRSELLKKAVYSLQLQRHQNLEIIIVDDCSTDDTEAVVGDMHDPRIKYIRHPINKGGSEARNTGIKHATGNYVGFLDSDDQWLPDKLEKQLAIFTSNPDVGAVYTGVKLFDDRQIIKEIVPRYRGDILPMLIESNCIDTTSSVLVKTALLHEINGFESALPSCQDWDLYLRLSKITNFDFVKDSMVLFFQHSGERISTNNAAVLSGQLYIFEAYKALAKELGDGIFGKFSINIFKTLLKVGITSHDKEAVKLARKVLLEAAFEKNGSIKAFVYYFSTFLPLKVLGILYKQSKKNNKFSEILST